MQPANSDELGKASGILRAFTNLVGPAAVMAAGTMGAGAMASFLLAGAWFRYDLLWVVLAMLPVFVVSADSASRIGSLNPERGMLSLVRELISGPLAWFILIVVVPVHFLVTMGQISVMSSAALTLLAPKGLDLPLLAEVLLAMMLTGVTLWLVLSRGYDRMQRVMTALMVAMFICFLLVAFRGLVELPAILRGFMPSIPSDLPVPGSDLPRVATTSIIGMVGAAIAPAALLGLPYMCADAGAGRDALGRSFRQSVINLGLVFGAYAILVVIAGGFALYTLPNNASFADVGQASQVFESAFPGFLAPAGPVIFALGLFMAAMTTLVVAAQVTIYFLLDMLRIEWRFTENNRAYHVALSVFVLAAAALAPLWDFPALLKVILLMGINVVVIPVVYVIVIVLSNRADVMHGIETAWWRNGLLTAGLIASVVLAMDKAPLYFRLLSA
ncbi:MAG: divalent metal cation transporter [Pseudomonadota bacterium]